MKKSSKRKSEKQRTSGKPDYQNIKPVKRTTKKEKLGSLQSMTSTLNSNSCSVHNVIKLTTLHKTPGEIKPTALHETPGEMLSQINLAVTLSPMNQKKALCHLQDPEEQKEEFPTKRQKCIEYLKKHTCSQQNNDIIIWLQLATVVLNTSRDMIVPTPLDHLGLLNLWKWAFASLTKIECVT